jgi:hypothetical protein
VRGILKACGFIVSHFSLLLSVDLLNGKETSEIGKSVHCEVFEKYNKIVTKFPVRQKYLHEQK